MNPILMRAMVEGDRGLIFNNWLKSYRKSEFAARIPGSLYFKEHEKLLHRILARAETVVASNEADPDQIYGWICFEWISDLPVIHYAYVKHCFRRLGIGRKLFDQVGVTGEFLYTHDAPIIERAKLRGLYSPHHAWSTPDAP